MLSQGLVSATLTWVLGADADLLALLVFHGFFAAQVAAFVVIDVIHIVHRASALAIVLIDELKSFVLGVAVLLDVVGMVEQVAADDTELALRDIGTNGRNHCGLLFPVVNWLTTCNVAYLLNCVNRYAGFRFMATDFQ
jgi:hypothetical protein